VRILEQTRDGVVVKIKVEILEEELVPEFEKAYQKAQKTAVMDGFRPGKVPLNLVKKRYGEAIREELIEDYIKRIYPEVLKTANLKPITPGDIREVEYKQKEYLHFTTVFELKPEFTLAEWRNTTIIKDVVTITEEDIEQELQSQRELHAIISERPEDQGVEMGDHVYVNIQGIDHTGYPIVGKKRSNIKIEIGKDRLGSNTDEQLIGAKKNEHRRVRTNCVFFNEHGEERREELIWETEILEIEQIELLELDDDLAAQIAGKPITLSELRREIEMELRSYCQSLVKQRLAQRMIDKMVELHKFDLPPSILAETLERMVQSRLKKVTDKIFSEDILRENLTEVAEKQLRWFFIRNKLIEEEQIQATDEDVENELKLRAETGKMDYDSLKLMFKSGEKRTDLEQEILIAKVMNVLHQGFKFDERLMDFNAFIDNN